MRTSGNGKNLCDEAREHYYDLLCRDLAAVPEDVVRHVEHCPLCREQLRGLEDALSETGGRIDPSKRPNDDESAVEALSRHFEFLGRPVGCSEARPFLPDLLHPAPPLRVPTPITVHVEHCPPCAKDLASLRALDLPAEQLRRLSLLYEQSADRAPSAAPARAALPAGPDGDGVLSCADISTAALFDCVIPFGPDTAAISNAGGGRDAVAAHVRTCRRCGEKARSLHETIYAIAARADSPVRTVYRSSEGAEDTGTPAYHYPISVEVLHSRTQRADDHADLCVARSGSERRPSTGRKARLPFRTALAAAAIIVAVSLLLVNAPTATGMNVRELLQAVERAANVHVVSRHRDQPRPSYEMWMARDLDVFAMKTGAECTVYDLRKRTRTVIPPDRGPGTPVALTPSELDRCRLFLSRTLGNVFADALASDSLSRVDDVPADRPGASLSVYELTRESHGGGAAAWHRWRVFLDPALQRPVRIEYSRRDFQEPAWQPAEVTVFTYPGRAEMENEIRAMLRAP